MAIFAVLLLISGAILAVAALAVHFAGNAAVVAGVDLSQVRDLATFNRWAGNRLLLLPVVALGFGYAGLTRPILALAGLAVLVVLGIVVVVWILVGAEKFRVVR